MKQTKKLYLQGTIKRHPDGFGFFIPENKENPDIYIPRNEMKYAMSNDRVMVEAMPDRAQPDRWRGEIVKILERKTKTVVGRYQSQGDSAGFLPDDSKAWGVNLKIPSGDSMGAIVGQLVEATIVQYPESGETFIGKVTKVLGDAASPLNDIQRVIGLQQIPDDFPVAVIKETEHLQDNPSPQDFAGRRDLQDLPLVTIDGATAKDFDDAVHVEQNSKGFLCHVAIADVSHYVRPGSEMDKEAYLRGTSVYFPNFVVPMLPEKISNGLCSLNPHVPRLCLVAEMQFDFQGVMTSSQFYEAVMKSHARITYGEAQQILEGSPPERFSEVKDVVHRCADLSKILLAKRYREGSLDLEIPETTLEIDAEGNPVDVLKSDRLFAHRLIEELMLAANVAVAKFFKQKDIPALYRIHDEPHADALENLEKYLQAFGAKTHLGSGQLQKRLSQALQQFAGGPHSTVLNILTLRSMNQAKYSVQNIGHFGLAFADYAHFTSPIRRYPDLIVHRLLKSQVMPNSRYRVMAEEDLLTAGTHLSACEQRAAKAERLIMSIKKARFMQKHVGEEFEGLITSVVKFGVFVSLREFDIDGLVRLEALAKEHLEFDEEMLVLFNKKTGRRYQIGDKLKIRVESADVDAGQINFVRVLNEKEQAHEKAHPSRPNANARKRTNARSSDRGGDINAKGKEEAIGRVSRKRKGSSGQQEHGGGKAKRNSTQERDRDRSQEGDRDRSFSHRPGKRKVKKSGSTSAQKHRKGQGQAATEKAPAASHRSGARKTATSKGPEALAGSETPKVQKRSLGSRLLGMLETSYSKNRKAKKEADAANKSDRKDPKKRGKNANHRGGVR